MDPETLQYRPATDPTQACAGCANQQNMMCRVLQMQVDPTMVCNAFQPVGANTAAVAGGQQPAPQDLMMQLFGGAGG